MKQLTFKNYYEIRDWLEGFIPLVWGKEELGLARIAYLLKLLRNPEKKFKSIHVAGTSGKGSTAYYIAQMLSNVNFQFQIINYKKNTESKNVILGTNEVRTPESGLSYLDFGCTRSARLPE